MPRVLVLSDLHLRATPTGRVRGVVTHAGLIAALDDARRHGPFDRVVLTGDLAEDPRRETYAVLRDLLRDRLPELTPYGSTALVLAGNHDRPAPMAEIFPRRTEAHAGSVGFVEELGGWRLVGLDSHWPGQIRGRVGQQQLAWLEVVLDADPRPVVLFVHHPPLRVGTWWLDGSRLADGDALAAVLARSARVRLVLFGHVHMAHDGRLGEARAAATPSTAFQFAGGSWLPRRGPAIPGYRIVDLEDGTVTTRACFVDARIVENR